MARVLIDRLTLRDFRSYTRLEAHFDGRPVALHGPNGAGKTNLLEAISLLAPGRGLRGARADEVGRRDTDALNGRPWAVSVRLATEEGPLAAGTGLEPPAVRRIVRIEGETVPAGRLAEQLRLVWMTPQQDRIFLDGAGERRRFLDRLTLAADPAHGARAAAFDRAMRERLKLLTAGPDDRAWLVALEAQAAAAGALLAAARERTVRRLQEEIDRRSERPFPSAGLKLTDDWGARPDAEDALIEALCRARERDRAAGRASIGPSRSDLDVVHREKNRAAAECSTGEQKALILNLVLAQAASLANNEESHAESAPNPILLLDEVAAHLDARRRAALFDEIVELRLQAFLTGTDEMLFSDLGERAQIARVERSELKL
jgi:DNA replication and repair protein RecF